MKIMRATVADRVNKHRAALRATGLRPTQIWVLDTRAAGFIEECRRQSRLAAAHDGQDKEMLNLLDEALSDIDGWRS